MSGIGPSKRRSYFWVEPVFGVCCALALAVVGLRAVISVNESGPIRICTGLPCLFFASMKKDDGVIFTEVYPAWVSLSCSS